MQSMAEGVAPIAAMPSAMLCTDGPVSSPVSGRDPEELAAVAKRTIMASLDLAGQVDEALDRGRFRS